MWLSYVIIHFWQEDSILSLNTRRDSLACVLAYIRDRGIQVIWSVWDSSSSKGAIGIRMYLFRAWQHCCKIYGLVCHRIAMFETFGVVVLLVGRGDVGVTGLRSPSLGLQEMGVVYTTVCTCDVIIEIRVVSLIDGLFCLWLLHSLKLELVNDVYFCEWMEMRFWRNTTSNCGNHALVIWNAFSYWLSVFVSFGPKREFLPLWLLS
jgi:hypothetical protein